MLSAFDPAAPPRRHRYSCLGANIPTSCFVCCLFKPRRPSGPATGTRTAAPWMHEAISQITYKHSKFPNKARSQAASPSRRYGGQQQRCCAGDAGDEGVRDGPGERRRRRWQLQGRGGAGKGPSQRRLGLPAGGRRPPRRAGVPPPRPHRWAGLRRPRGPARVPAPLQQAPRLGGIHKLVYLFKLR